MFEELDEYGSKVIKYFSDKKKYVILLLSKERPNELLHGYSDYFEMFLENRVVSIRLKEEDGVSRLWEKFRRYLSVDIMLAFMDKVSASVLRQLA